MQVTLPKGATLAPGQKSPLVVTFTDAAGKPVATQGEGHGKIRWADLDVKATVVTVSDKGVVQMPKLPWQSDGKVGHVQVTVPGKPELTAGIDVTPRYNVAYRATFSGDNGPNGMDGTNGISGTSGLTGSIDPNHPSAGGNGSDGTNGTSGNNGGMGGDGPPVLVEVALWPGDHPLLEVAVSISAKDKEWYLIDPNGGSLTVASAGGPGGNGGHGGKGGRGGSGGIGTPNGMDGHDGLDGQDGLRGMDGSPGRITMVYDPAAQPYLSAIHLTRSGVKPVMTEKPVPPLW